MSKKVVCRVIGHKYKGASEVNLSAGQATASTPSSIPVFTFYAVAVGIFS